MTVGLQRQVRMKKSLEASRGFDRKLKVVLGSFAHNDRALGISESQHERPVHL